MRNIYYKIETAGGYGFTTPNEEEVNEAIKTKKVTVWVGGSAGIVDDWGMPALKTLRKVTRMEYNPTTKEIISEVIFENPYKRKK